VLRSTRPRDSVRAGVGLVPANRHTEGLVMTESVEHNLTLASLRDFVRAGRIQRRSENQAAQRDISAFGVKTSSAETAVGALSGGNQQKVVLAKWLRTQPKVLLLDEPTQGVDVAAQADLHQTLMEAAARGTAMVVCSSDELELSQLCDRVVILRNGLAEAELSGSELTAANVFEATIAVADESATVPGDRAS
jgi:ribose transport system ATP-binding protein